MNISTNNDKRYMTNDYYIQHSMPAVELKLNKTLAKNPHLILIAQQISYSSVKSKIFSHCSSRKFRS